MSKDKKYTYRVLPGRSWGPYKEYGPGSTIDLTVDEAEGFRDSLALVKGEDTPADLVPDETPDDKTHFASMTVAQLTSLPEWSEVEPPRPTKKDDIIAAILAIREAGEEADE